MHEEIRQCAHNTYVKCSTPGVQLVNALLANEDNSLEDYMAAHNYAEGPQDDVEIMSTLLYELSRENVSDDATLTPLGNKFNVRAKHFIEVSILRGTSFGRFFCQIL